MDKPGFWILECWEETSQFNKNPNKRWNYGSECYEALVKYYIPDTIDKCQSDLIDSYIENNFENMDLYVKDNP